MSKKGRKMTANKSCDIPFASEGGRMKTTGDHWHKNMYDTDFAANTIGSKKLRDVARDEVAFLVSALGLSSGDQVLDAPCGAGRHAAEFAKRGVNVTGIDISHDCLKLAKASCQRLPAKFEQADMASLKSYRGQFDATVNLFTSFGYFSTDQKNEAVLRELISTLRPGGRLALHLINRDWLLKVFRPVDWSEAKGKLTLEARKYDPKTHYNEAQLVMLDRKTGRGKSYYHRVRLYSKVEVVALMKRCGLKDIRVFGNFEGGKFGKYESSHPIYIGRKP